LTFDYMLANPPFGVEWKQQQRFVEHERDTLGYEGRFGAGTWMQRRRTANHLEVAEGIKKQENFDSKPCLEFGSPVVISRAKRCERQQFDERAPIRISHGNLRRCFPSRRH